METYFTILRKCPLFDDIEDENILKMVRCLDSRVVSFDKNENIMKEGDDARYFGILLSGAAQIVRSDFYGNRSLVAHIEPSQLFGESFAWSAVEQMPVNVIASEETEVMLIDSRKLANSCGTNCQFHSKIIFNLLKIVATKNLIFHQKIEVTSKRTTREKLMTYLLLQAKRNGSNSFTIPYDRQALADYLEVERSGLSVEISKLKKEGLIENKKNRFTLLK